MGFVVPRHSYSYEIRDIFLCYVSFGKYETFFCIAPCQKQVTVFLGLMTFLAGQNQVLTYGDSLWSQEQGSPIHLHQAGRNSFGIICLNPQYFTGICIYIRNSHRLLTYNGYD